MEFDKIDIESPEDSNVIIGMSHFIKTVEDLYEAIITSVTDCKFGIGFCEASGPRLVRSAGNSEELIKAAEREAEKIGAGHSFIVIIEDAFPINVLSDIKNVSEVCSVLCATANPLQVLVAETDQGRGITGVVDGYSPKGIEEEDDKRERKEFLREIGYKL